MTRRRVIATVVGLASLAIGTNAAEAQDHLTPFLQTSVSGVANASTFNYDFAVSTYQLLTTSLRFDDKNEKQKLNFAPGKLRKVITECTWTCELTLNLVHAKDAATFGFGGAWLSKAIYTPTARTIARGITKGQASCRLQPNPGGDLDQFALEKALCFKTVQQVADRYFTELARWNWAFTYGANWQSFATLGGTKVDLDSDGKIDNAYTMKGWNANVGAVVTPDMRSAYSLSYNFTRKRGTQVEGAVLTPYHSAAVTGAWRLMILDANYRESDAYKKKLFIPAWLAGLSVEGQWCMRKDVGDCADRTRSAVVATVFTDFKLTSDSQFRIGFPYAWKLLAAKSETSAQPVVQLGFGLSSL